MNLKLASGAVVALFGIVTIPSALAAENVRVRGTIVSLDGSTLTVKTREGPDAALALKPEWKVTGVAKASVEDIKPGDFVGIASLPAAALALAIASCASASSRWPLAFSDANR